MITARHLGLEVRGNSGGEELVLCPWHHDTNPSAWFNPRRGLFYCAVCHLGLNVSQLAKKLNIILEEAEYYASESAVEEYNLFGEQLRLDLGEEVYHSYFERRNVSEAAVHNYGVRWSEDKRAAVFPTTDLEGKVRGVTYRYTKGRQRYMKLGETFPVWPMCILPSFNPKRMVVVVEGAFSTLRINTVDAIVQSVAILGAKANRKLVELLRPFQCVFLYDGDSAGRTACLRMRSMAPLSYSWTVDSPDDCTDVEIQILIEKIERATGYGR
jgi:DNA primase